MYVMFFAGFLTALLILMIDVAADGVAGHEAQIIWTIGMAVALLASAIRSVANNIKEKQC